MDPGVIRVHQGGLHACSTGRGGHENPHLDPVFLTAPCFVCWQDELRVATTLEAKTKVLAMYAQACPEYNSVALWLDRLDLARGAATNVFFLLISSKTDSDGWQNWLILVR